ncbi:MAG: c-type cytochrome [Pseudomonas sp.]|nr:c-type cytochrome [Pseudomonas sp.]
MIAARPSHLLLIALLSCGLPAMADDLDHGKALFSACSSCHGEQAQGSPALAAPVLAGQQQSYLIRQLGNFKSGLRGSNPADSAGAQMQAMAATLSDEQAIADLSAYLASLPPPASKPSLSGNAALGSRLYQAKCGACHGGQAEGNLAMHSPRLRQQLDSYLLLQVNHFKQGIRGSAPGDRYGKQMKMMAATVNDQELLDVLAHISNLPQP